jgi:hypothetical protein
MKLVIVEDIKESLWAIIFVVIVLLGGWLGFQVGSFIQDIPKTGVFTSWELLNSPVRFIEIIYVNSNTIWAQTAEDKLYFWGLCDSIDSVTCGQWTEMGSIPSDAYRDDHSQMVKGKDCPENDVGLLIKKYPGKIVECSRVLRFSGAGGNFTYFALLEDGTIWEWDIPSGTDVPIIALCIGPFVGLSLGIVIGVWVLRLRKKIQN